MCAFFLIMVCIGQDVRIIERRKVDGIYVFVVELISNLHKYQRREYYRFNCVIDMGIKKMTKQEIDAYIQGMVYLVPDREMIRGVIVDISGGGARFVSRQRFDEDSYILMKFKLTVLEREKLFLLAAKIIYSNEIENRENEYENRVKFEFIDTTTREEIIKYIFDEERKK